MEEGAPDLLKAYWTGSIRVSCFPETAFSVKGIADEVLEVSLEEVTWAENSVASGETAKNWGLLRGLELSN